MSRYHGYILPWVIWLTFFSCTIHEKTFDNPVDFKSNEEKGIGAPTLVFYPKTQIQSIQDSVLVESFLVFNPEDFELFAGIHLQIDFPNEYLEFDTATPGIFVTDTNKITPLFTYTYDGNGTIDVFTYFLDTLSLAMEGSGHLANLIFNPIGTGSDSIRYNLLDCEIINYNDSIITLEGERGAEVIVQ